MFVDLAGFTYTADAHDVDSVDGREIRLVNRRERDRTGYVIVKADKYNTLQHLKSGTIVRFRNYHPATDTAELIPSSAVAVSVPPGTPETIIQLLEHFEGREPEVVTEIVNRLHGLPGPCDSTAEVG